MTDLDVRPDVAAAGPLRRPARWWTALAGALLVLLALAGGVLLGQRTAATGQLEDEVSIGFVRDMQVHHAQAVAMSEPLHRRSDDPAVNYLAFDVLTTQQGQLGMMSGWLDLAGASQSGSAPTMAWMGHDGAMPGLATEEQVSALATLPLGEATEQYLRLMVRHHRGAVEMARYAAEHAEHPSVALLARNMDAGQSAEIELMQDLLRQRGHAPEPEAAAEPGEQPGSDAGHGGHGS